MRIAQNSELVLLLPRPAVGNECWKGREGGREGRWERAAWRWIGGESDGYGDGDKVGKGSAIEGVLVEIRSLGLLHLRPLKLHFLSLIKPSNHQIV